MAPPAPAWPPPRTDNPAVNQLLSPTLTYDHAHHPVIAGNRLYYGSSADGSVVCLDAETGEFRWRFATEGPVRLAPRLTRGRILAASDDGLLYCLDAETGASLWTYRPGPEDRRLMGNGRPMSVWPIRCGICVRDGTAYVAAGLFPSHGTYLCAVDVETGEEEWKRPLDCSPQGFMLASPDRLFVPTGRTPFRVYRRSDGQPLATLGRSDSWGKSLPGGCCAVVVDEQLVTGPGEDGDLYVFDVTSAETLVRAPGTQIVVDGLVTYALGDRKISALERSYLQGSQPKVLWEQTCGKAHCLIRTAEHLCVGTDAGVEVISSTNGEHRGRVPFPAPVLGLAIAESRLYAATADGRIHCLSNRTPEAPLTHRLQAEPAPDTADADQTMAREALDLLGSTQGVCLIVGADTTDLARELAASSRLQVIQAVTDPAVAHSLRQALAEQGLLGQGIALHTVGVPALPYQRHLANLVIDLTLHDTAADAVPDTELLRVLRPYGGLLLQRRQALPDALPPGQPIRTGPESAFGAAFRRGHVPGAGSWTHCYADLGNTACSGDLTPFTEYGLLWFGRPGPRRMLERHIKGAPPLAADGLLFITGKDYLAGLDAYNGTILWEKDVPGSGRVGVLKDCGNMALAPDSLYVACDSACLLLDPSTGNQRAAIDVESVAGVPGHWGYTAWIGDLLLGTRTPPGAELQAGDAEDYTTIWKHHRPVVCSSHLFAADRHNGTRLWCHAPEPGLIANPTITVLGDRVFFLESTNPEPRRQDLGKVPLADLFANGPRVTALDLRTGEVAWSAAVDLSLFHHSLYMSGKDGTLVLCGSRHAPVDGQELIQYELLALDAGNGDLRWQNSNTPTRAHILDGGHGEQIQHPAIVGETVYGPGFARNLHTGEVVDGWLWNKSPQCATLSASATCAFSRQNGLPTVEAFADGSKLHLTRTTRPGCWINTLPIGGMVVIPEASSGCTCGYSVQASLGLAPR
jgi:outer membrane protein assembly factor BamB